MHDGVLTIASRKLFQLNTRSVGGVFHMLWHVHSCAVAAWQSQRAQPFK